MSYILDALKKADAERERSAVPGLHAHPQDGLSAQRERTVPWPVLAIGAIALLGGALAWVLLSDSGVRTPPLVAAAPAAPLPPPAVEQAPTPPTPAAAPVPTPAPMAAPTATPLPTPAAAPPPVAAPAPAPTVPTATPAAPPAPTTTAAPAATAPRPAQPDKGARAAAAPKAAPAPEPRVPSLAELPADVRAGVPALAISGAVYSPTPSARMLFISGQVLREGDAVTDGVVVERIGASASVLSVRGQKFEVRH